MIIGAIPVKKESKRFPGKNFMKIGGDYLINKAISRLKDHVDCIIISTDAKDQVVKIINEGGDATPFNRITIVERSEDVLDGDLPSNEPIRQAISDTMRFFTGDTVVMTQVTTPLIRSQTVARCIEEWRSVTRYQQGQRPDLIVTVNPDYRPNGGVYVFHASHLCNPGPLYRGNVRLCKIPFKEGIDIDYQYQLPIAEAVLMGGIVD
jgi:CMP-N-acetylneuraminic acid synthetase